MKLSEKFARQESEAARLARIARRRLSTDRLEAVRKFLGVTKPDATAPTIVGSIQICDECGRRFALPMHLGRHRKSKHGNRGVADGAVGDHDPIQACPPDRIHGTWRSIP